MLIAASNVSIEAVFEFLHIYAVLSEFHTSKSARTSCFVMQLALHLKNIFQIQINSAEAHETSKTASNASSEAVLKVMRVSSVSKKLCMRKSKHDPHFIMSLAIHLNNLF